MFALVWNSTTDCLDSVMFTCIFGSYIYLFVFNLAKQYNYWYLSEQCQISLQYSHMQNRIPEMQHSPIPKPGPGIPPTTLHQSIYSASNFNLLPNSLPNTNYFQLFAENMMPQFRQIFPVFFQLLPTICPGLYNLTRTLSIGTIIKNTFCDKLDYSIFLQDRNWQTQKSGKGKHTEQLDKYSSVLINNNRTFSYH